ELGVVDEAHRTPCPAVPRVAQGARARAHSCVPERVVTIPAEKPAVFGFAIGSEIPLQFLRHGGRSGSLEIVEMPQREEVYRRDLLGLWGLQGTSYPARARLFRVRN